MISNVYRVRLDFEYPPARQGLQYCDDVMKIQNKLDDELLDLVKDAVHPEIFTGNAACGPYIIAEYDTAVGAMHAEARLKHHLLKKLCLR